VRHPVLLEIHRELVAALPLEGDREALFHVHHSDLRVLTSLSEYTSIWLCDQVAAGPHYGNVGSQAQVSLIRMPRSPTPVGPRASPRHARALLPAAPRTSPAAPRAASDLRPRTHGRGRAGRPCATSRGAPASMRCRPCPTAGLRAHRSG